MGSSKQCDGVSRIPTFPSSVIKWSRCIFQMQVGFYEKKEEQE